MPLRELLALFGIRMEDRQLKKANKTINESIGRLKTLGGLLIGGFVVRGIANFIGSQIREADVLSKTAEKLGLTTSELQELRFAAQQAGVQQMAPDIGVQRFTRRVAEAAAGTGEAKDTLAEMGIELTNAQGVVRPTSELLGDVADALQQTESQADRVRIAFKLFDTEGVALVTMLQEGGEGLLAMRERFQELGGGISEEFARAAADATDQLGELDVVVTGLKSQLVLALLPTIRRVVGRFVEFGRKISDAAEGTDLFERGIRMLKIAAVAAGVAITIAFAKPILIFLAVAAAVGLIALAVDDLITFFEGGESVIGKFLDEALGVGEAERLVQDFRSAWEELSAAFREAGIDWGDVLGAIVWLVKVLVRAWVVNITVILRWLGFVVTVFRVWMAAIRAVVMLAVRLSKAWDRALARIKVGAKAVGAFFSGIWSSIVSGFRDAVNAIIREARRLPGAGIAAAALGAAGGAVPAVAGRVVTAPAVRYGGGANLVQHNKIDLTIQTPAGAQGAGVVQTLRRTVLGILGEERRQAIDALEQAGEG